MKVKGILFNKKIPKWRQIMKLADGVFYTEGDKYSL